MPALGFTTYVELISYPNARIDNVDQRDEASVDESFKVYNRVSGGVLWIGVVKS